MKVQFYPDFDRFRELAGGGINVVPVWASVLSDTLTPVTAYASLAGASTHSFLLESVIGGEKIGRYSFLSADPVLTFDARGEALAISEGDQTRKLTCADPLNELQAIMGRYRSVHLPELPRFLGGVVGYAAYDMVRYYERLTGPGEDDRGLADLLFGLYPDVVVFDHVTKTIKVVSNAMIDDDPRAAYGRACERIERMLDRLGSPVTLGMAAVDLGVEPALRFTSNVERSAFEGAVDRCKEYIRAGDIFQVVLSQRLAVHTQADPFSIYRALRVINPSPYMFHLRSPQCTLVGASPEVMCRVEEGLVTNRPLAGTRRRGRTEAEDKALEKDLLDDPKERAEHIMLVDLGRNDVGKVCELGSVDLTEVMAVERYSHVMHISSNVQGKLAAGRTAFDALRATLPVGTVSGAPKVRAMQIIDEFEPTKRGPYAGAVGYVDFSGNMDTCIALRTLVLQGQTAYVQVGAGIVADSVPANEYQETINKAKGQLKAIETAEQAIDE